MVMPGVIERDQVIESETVGNPVVGEVTHRKSTGAEPLVGEPGQGYTFEDLMAAVGDLFSAVDGDRPKV